MKFSIVVPSYNQGVYIEDTLKSILEQRGVSVEVIVHDGGSTDGTIEVLRRYDPHITWTSARDHGQTDAINKGLRSVSGDIVAYLNSDDVYLPGALARVAAAFSADPNCEIIYGSAQHLHADGSFMEEYPTEPWNYDRLFEACYLCQPAVFWRRSLHARHGYFDERLHFAMDYEFWLRIGASTPFGFLPGEPLAGSRLHADTKTLRNRVPVHREILQAVRRHAQQPDQCYRWLRHLASLSATDAGFPPSSDPERHRRHVECYLRHALLYADEFRIALNCAVLEELTALAHPASLL